MSEAYRQSPVYDNGVCHLFGAEVAKICMHDDWRSNGGCASVRLANMDDAMNMKRMQRFIDHVSTADSLSPCLMACMDSNEDGNFHCGCQHVR